MALYVAVRLTFLSAEKSFLSGGDPVEKASSSMWQMTSEVVVGCHHGPKKRQQEKIEHVFLVKPSSRVPGYRGTLLFTHLFGAADGVLVTAVQVYLPQKQQGHAPLPLG